MNRTEPQWEGGVSGVKVVESGVKGGVSGVDVGVSGVNV